MQPPAAVENVAPASSGTGLSLLFRPDPNTWDGRFSDNGWLQELPKPLTKIVWDNPIAVSPALAEKHGLADGDLVRLTVGDRSLEGHAWVLPGQAANTITLYMGYGRRVPEAISYKVGYDAFALQGKAGSLQIQSAILTRLNGKTSFATTQDHSTMEGHDFIRRLAVGATMPLSQPEVLFSASQSTKLSDRSEDHRAWAMVIDLDTCIGCNACMVACQAENNIPIVGRDEVAAGREMHWLRIDRYYSNLKGGEGLDDPDTHFQPVPCMHCEDAPCEIGCPVEATLHDHEGLNLMVYNRCIGTRACSSYCPYKVRHFNYLDYTDLAPALELQRNPDVTVRAKGVMEKCTYCVQRIAAARIDADKTDGIIPEGSVVTACQAACPARAISFGDLDQRGSAVASARSDPRHYALLAELNVKPRTTYLAERGPAKQSQAMNGAGTTAGGSQHE